MQWILIFIALPLAGLACSVFEGLRAGSGKATRHAGLVAKAFFPAFPKSRLYPRCKHKIDWISAQEFQAWAHKSNDVILIDLGSQTLGDPAEFRCPDVLLIEPRELQDVLFWAPPTSRIVVYGPRYMCVSVIPKISEVPGATPVHFLSESPRAMRSCRA
jgi:hypothetical protein